MSETQQPKPRIDLLAATINRDATLIVAAADEWAKSQRSVALINRGMPGSEPDPEREGRAARADLRVADAETIRESANAIRKAALRIQSVIADAQPDTWD